MYDKYYDCAICPEYHVPHNANTIRNGYWEHKIGSTSAKTTNAKVEKTVKRHVWQDYVESAAEARYTQSNTV